MMLTDKDGWDGKHIGLCNGCRCPECLHYLPGGKWGPKFGGKR